MIVIFERIKAVFKRSFLFTGSISELLFILIFVGLFKVSIFWISSQIEAITYLVPDLVDVFKFIFVFIMLFNMNLLVSDGYAILQRRNHTFVFILLFLLFLLKPVDGNFFHVLKEEPYIIISVVTSWLLIRLIYYISYKYFYRGVAIPLFFKPRFMFAYDSKIISLLFMACKIAYLFILQFGVLALYSYISFHFF